ncbi:class I SAM-dependent methyltransferase [Patescibacteria group bacterium]|nr:class I SAM-dependent methyltransferase [Patescibacteria group bacterium]
MTIWDKIYKNYQKGGLAWASLSEGIHPLFRSFLVESEFSSKSVLDIGCGMGKYLKFLQSKGFKTDGIDSSETAVEATKNLLGDGSMILCVNMFEFEIPRNKYDLIISISTIHHGTKENVKRLIREIHALIRKNGKIFITLPDLESAKKWDTFKEHENLSRGVYAPLSGPEKGLPHSFYSKEEIEIIFSIFKEVKLDLDDIGRWIIRGEK